MAECNWSITNQNFAKNMLMHVTMNDQGSIDGYSSVIGACKCYLFLFGLQLLQYWSRKKSVKFENTQQGIVIQNHGHIQY